MIFVLLSAPALLNRPYREIAAAAGVALGAVGSAWPPDMVIVMNVAGYVEALDSAVTVCIVDHCEIPVVSIPGLVMTKLIAWLDRGQSNPKDAVDFRYLLENYAAAGNERTVQGVTFHTPKP